MPSKNPRLTATDHQRIQAYRRQGLTRTAIAEKLGCGYHQVRNYLRHLHDATRVRVPITKSQYLIITRIQQSGLNTHLLAARLEMDAAILYQELAGEKSMSTQRVGAL
jgi:DNA-binding transcriptional regulator LsrR (DeoR family)